MPEFLTNENPEAGAKAPDTEFYLGTVSTWSSSNGVEITLDGQSAHMTKRFKMLLTGRPLPLGSRVVVMKQSGTYIVLGQISNPVGYNTIPDLPSNATTANIISKINSLLAALRTQGVIWTS